MRTRSKQRLIFPGCVLIAAILLLVCTKSSPLYPLNDWVDCNIYFTIGKGLMNGRVPYLDLYDQKGPFVYLLYGLAALLSPDSFLGVYVLEALSFGAFLYLAYRTVALYCDRYAALTLPLLGALILSAMSVSHGGSLEEFCLPVFAYGLYSALAYYKRDDPARRIRMRTVLLNGFLAGLLLFSKFTLLAFYFAFMAVLFLSQCLRGDWRYGLLCCAAFVCAMLGAGVPWVIYFAAHGALREFYYYYFYTNIFGYATLESPTLLQLLFTIIKATAATLLRNAQYSVLIALGLGFVLFGKKSGLPTVGKLAVLAMFLLLPCGLYLGGQSYRYYGLTLAAFAPLGCVPPTLFLNERLAPRLQGRVRPYALTAALTLLGVGFSLLVSSNVYLLGVPKSETPQGRFAAVMEREKEGGQPTLLCRAFPDSGFYLAAGVIPFNRFFSSNNVMLPENAAEQVRLVEEGAAQFVVTRGRADVPGPLYELLDTASLWYEGDVWTYRLYRRKAGGR